MSACYESIMYQYTHSYELLKVGFFSAGYSKAITVYIIQDCGFEIMLKMAFIKDENKTLALC